MGHISRIIKMFLASSYQLLACIGTLLLFTVRCQPSSSSSMTQLDLQQQQQRRYMQLSPQQQGLRPAGLLEELPPPDLIEPAPRADDPRINEINVTALRLKLAANFDPNFMSISYPEGEDAVTGGNVANFGFRRNRLGRLIPTGVMPDYLSKMDFKYVTLTNGSKLRTKITSKLKRKIQQFLWAYTACSVVYKWRDLGIRFWPRYLKEGICPEDVSCSIPPGMSCSPSNITHKTILRWYCKGGGGPLSASSGKHCQWIKADYPVLTECSCSCPPGASSNKHR